MTIVIAIIILLGGGASFAAENVLPGDALYPVKVSVNEEVKSAFSFSSEAKAMYEIRRAEKRLLEAEKLAAMGRLDATGRANAVARFESHAEAFAEHAAEAESEKGAEALAEVRAKFEAMLEARESALIELKGKGGSTALGAADVSAEIGNVVTSVRATLDSVLRAKGGAKAEMEMEAEAEEEMNGGDEEEGKRMETGSGASMKAEGSAGAGAGVKTEGSVTGEVSL